MTAALALAAATRGRAVAVEQGLPGPGTLEAVARLQRRHEGVLLAGAGWPAGLVDRLAVMLLSPLAVVDVLWPSGRPRRPNVVFLHPAPRGDPQGYWPSTTLYLSTLLGNPYPLLAAASIVAMLGPMARAHRLYQNLMAMAGLDPNRDYNIARECMLQAYGPASMGDPRVHASLPESLAAAGDPCKALLQDHLATTLRAQAEAALAEARVEYLGVKAGFHRYHASGAGRHVLEVARPLAVGKGRVLVEYVDESTGHGMLCAWSTRRGDPPLPRLIPRLHGRGVPAWGVYQGVLNLVCAESRVPRDVLEVLAVGEE